MKESVDGICVLYYRTDGDLTLREWSIGCDAANDTFTTLAAHLARWKQGAELVGVDIRPVQASLEVPQKANKE